MKKNDYFKENYLKKKDKTHGIVKIRYKIRKFLFKKRTQDIIMLICIKKKT